MCTRGHSLCSAGVLAGCRARPRPHPQSQCECGPSAACRAGSRSDLQSLLRADPPSQKTIARPKAMFRAWRTAQSLPAISDPPLAPKKMARLLRRAISSSNAVFGLTANCCSAYCAGGAGCSCVAGGVIVGSFPAGAASTPGTTGVVVTVPEAASVRLML